MVTESTKQAIDAASIMTMIGSMGAILPPMAALFTIVWTAIRIYETKTIQALLGKDDDAG